MPERPATEQKSYITKLPEIGVYPNSQTGEFYYNDARGEAIAISKQEAKDLAREFVLLEKQATKTSKESSENLLASIGIRKTEHYGYTNRSGERIPPQQLLQTLKSLIETDKLLEGIVFHTTKNSIDRTPEISTTHAKHLDNHDVKIEKIITQTTKFIAGIGGATASWESNNCCDINRLIINPEDQGYATLFEHGNLSAGVKNNGKALRGATFNLRINFR